MMIRRFSGLARQAIGLGLVLAALSGVALAQTQVVPEVDPGSMISGMTLLAGGLLILTNRARRK
jgi:hypothetical protein